MTARTFAMALHTFREFARARALHALFALALAACLYAALTAVLSLHEELRVVADVGAASISLCAAAVAIVLGANLLHREASRSAIFFFLTRALSRREYVVGKYLGTLLTLAVFIALTGAAVLAVLASFAGAGVSAAALSLALLAALVVLRRVAQARRPSARTFVVVPWSLACFVLMATLANGAGAEQRLVMASCLLTLAEAAIVAALGTFFGSFTSPALAAVFTLGTFVIGRIEGTLGNHLGANVLARVVPNLQVYTPPRALLLGEVTETPVWPFVLHAAANALMYAVLLVTLGALAFGRRDFP